MQTMSEQMLGVSPDAKIMDHSDAVEGACWLLENKAVQMEGGYSFGAVQSRKF